VSVGLFLCDSDNDSVTVRQTEWQTVAARVKVSVGLCLCDSVRVRQTELQTVAVRVKVSVGLCLCDSDSVRVRQTEW